MIRTQRSCSRVVRLRGSHRSVGAIATILSTYWEVVTCSWNPTFPTNSRRPTSFTLDGLMEDITRSDAPLSPAGPGQIANAGVQRRPQRNTSRSGCATCRRRKVRCDQRRDVCGNCTRLKLSCLWYRPNELSQRSRVNTACERCRKKKVSCNKTLQMLTARMW